VLLDLEIFTKPGALAPRKEAGQALGEAIRALFPGKADDGKWHYLPILLVSAFDDTDTVVKGILDGADGFVTKTLSQNKIPLGEQIRLLLERTGRAKHNHCAEANEKARASANPPPTPTSSASPGLSEGRPDSRPSVAREAACFRIVFAGKEAVFKLLEGFADLAWLFRHEGKDVASNDLAHRPALSGVKTKRKKGDATDVAEMFGATTPAKRGPRKGSDSDPIYDEEGIANLDARIAELLEEGTVEALEEADYLKHERRKVLDQHGRPRALNSQSNSARSTVHRRIKSAVELIMAQLPELWEHLGGDHIFAQPRRKPAALTLGYLCSYRPASPMDWDVKV